MNAPGSPAVEIGLLLPTREAYLSGAHDPARLIELAVEAEKLGFDSVWAGDSPIARPRLDALTLLAAVAARTARVRLGTAVLLAALRPPVIAAHALASLDRLASGRLVVGVGAGFPLPATEAEFAAAGVPFKQRVGRLMETVAIWRSLWSAERPVDFEGRYWQLGQLEVEPKPVQAGGPPLWLAGSAPRALERAGASFDGWLPYPPTAAQYAEQLGSVRHAARHQRRSEAVTPALYATILLEHDPALAEQRLGDYVQAYYGLPLEIMRQIQGFAAGSAANVAEWLHRYIEAGARHIVLRLATLDDPLAMLRRAAEVIPDLQGLEIGAGV